MMVDRNSPDWIKLRSVIPLRAGRTGIMDAEQPSAERITNLSEDTLRRRFPHLIKKLSPRRTGMTLADALAIASGEAAQAAG
jgi:hypothetical protein